MNMSNIFIVLMLVVFYLFIILPQLKRTKKQKSFRAELKKGDKVVTTGGIHGKISEMKELTIVVDTGGGSKLKIDKSAISMEASELANQDTEV